LEKISGWLRVWGLNHYSLVPHNYADVEAYATIFPYRKNKNKQHLPMHLEFIANSENSIHTHLYRSQSNS